MSPILQRQKDPDKASNLPKSINGSSELSPRVQNSNNSSVGTSYPTGMTLILIFVSLCTSTFLVTLDGTIIATAIPTITSQFNSLNGVSWYNVAFLLTTCAFQLPYGRAYSLFNMKWVFISAIVIFEVGSTICGTAPNSLALIIGRAIAGIGSGGIFSGCFIVIAKIIPLRKRSLFAGLIGAMFGIASVVGPLLGGAFTTRVSWRRCFYINLPVGGIALAVVTLFLPKSSWLDVFKKFDPIGTALFVSSIICLLLALHPRVITTLTCFGVSIIAWAVFQYFQGENATIPKSVLSQRSVVGACLYTMFGAASFSAVVYYLPIWFQAIRQDDAEQSGIHTLPLILSLVIVSVSSGALVSICGYYTPFLILGTVLMSVGAGLLYTLKADVSTGPWIGYQILFGAGIGMTLEQCNIPAGTSLATLVRSLGGSIAVAICQNVFEQKLWTNLVAVLPDLDVSVIGRSGATALVANARAALGGNSEAVQEVLNLYNDAVVQTFLVALILAALTLPAALLVEWKSVKKEKSEESEDKEKAAVKV
ncbi:MFS general substrate transporter [Mollisia scopiformis]|uniref:MFS general substrate transporter n=1 Tax=Mollisia scopiformis TaxID=149040 RepID=A0A132B3T1_MOLSC|nr:MFS general substrate transporter [Mollisia scopiformis]KUJ07065.1 MFS general substrate transporter [Mollisia scopiformis]